MEVIRLEEKFCKNCGKLITKRRNIYCDSNCQFTYQYRKYIEDWKEQKNDGTKGNIYKDISNHIRRYLFEKYNNKCSQCGWGEVNIYTNKIPLEIHHRDGDCTNNKEDNLDLLCPNCHSLTKNYGSLNKGNSTRYKK